MTLKIKKSNALLKSAIIMLERKGSGGKSPIWREAATYLASGTVSWPEVNVGHLARLEASTVFVPGKVLGTGTIDKKVTVGAFSFSASAKAKIEAAGGKAFTIEEFVKHYPEGSGVALVK